MGISTVFLEDLNVVIGKDNIILDVFFHFHLDLRVFIALLDDLFQTLYARLHVLYIFRVNKWRDYRQLFKNSVVAD